MARLFWDHLNNVRMSVILSERMTDILWLTNMKKINLQSLAHILIMSIGLGFLVNIFVFKVAEFVHTPTSCLYWPETRFYCTDYYAQYGWPIQLHTKIQSDQAVPISAFVINFLIFTGAVFFILYIYRNTLKRYKGWQ